MTTLEIAKRELKPGWSLIAFQNNQLIGEWMPDLIPEWILAHSDVLRWEVNSSGEDEVLEHSSVKHYIGSMHKTYPDGSHSRTLELSSDDCASLAHALLRERGYAMSQGASTTPVLDTLLRKLHQVYPEQNWIRFL